jgi:hypothetical protein
LRHDNAAALFGSTEPSAAARGEVREPFDSPTYDGKLESRYSTALVWRR